jgi:molybdenum cofactor sulfurtransferase
MHLLNEVNTIRQNDFPQLKNHIYLDTAGTLPCPLSLVKNFHRDLSENVYGNPHSNGSPSSYLTSKRVSQVRERILNFLNAPRDEYEVIFTPNATGGLKLVSEIFFSEETPSSVHQAGKKFWYLTVSHTSVVGIRESAYRLIEKSGSHNFEELVSSKSEQQVNDFLRNAKEEDCEGLFAYPAQCNFSGKRYPLTWIRKFQKIRGIAPHVFWRVLVDASSYCSTGPLDLTEYPADFLVLSFYKIFGFPTGIGALILKKQCVSTAALTNRSYYGGGTVDALAFDKRWYEPRKRSIHSAFEDGTINFLDIIALSHGFDYVERKLGGWVEVGLYTRYLIQELYLRLKSLKLRINNREDSLCEIYLDNSNSLDPLPSNHGPILNFNIRRGRDHYVGYTEVMRLAAQSNIHIRTGCFCNLGACNEYLGLSSIDVQANHKVSCKI